MNDTNEMSPREELAWQALHTKYGWANDEEMHDYAIRWAIQYHHSTRRLYVSQYAGIQYGEKEVAYKKTRWGWHVEYQKYINAGCYILMTGGGPRLSMESYRGKVYSIPLPPTDASEVPDYSAMYHIGDHSYFDADGRNRYDEGGFDKKDFNRYGFDREGFNKKGYDCKGFDHDGFDCYGFDDDEKYRDGTWFGPDGFNRSDLDRDGYNRQGLDQRGYDRDGYDRDGRTFDGYCRDGFDKSGFDREHYNRQGFDLRGLDRDGYDREGIDWFGYDRAGVLQRFKPEDQCKKHACSNARGKGQQFCRPCREEEPQHVARLLRRVENQRFYAHACLPKPLAEWKRQQAS